MGSGGTGVIPPDACGMREEADEGSFRGDDDDDGSGLPTPGPTTGDEEMTASQRKLQEEADMADLEADLIAEMETME